MPTNFHTGSQELRFIRIFWIFWSYWRQAGGHGVLLVYSTSFFPLHCLMLYTLMIWCNVIIDIVLCFKDYSFIYYMLFRCDYEILILFLFCFLISSIFFFYLFFLTLTIRFSSIRLCGIWYSGRKNADLRIPTNRNVTFGIKAYG